jgi:hypothetical protein
VPEYSAVIALYGVGETLVAKLIGEIGDVRCFESKRSRRGRGRRGKKSGKEVVDRGERRW